MQSALRGKIILTVLDKIKNALVEAKKTDNIETYQNLVDIQKDCRTLINENSELKKQITILEAEREIGDKLIVIGDTYFLKNDDCELDGPFCLKCWDDKRKLVKMKVTGGLYYFISSCPKCGYVASYIDPN